MSASFAFMVPTRDALLSRVASSNIQNAVMLALIAQFAAQLMGYVLAGAALAGRAVGAFGHADHRPAYRLFIDPRPARFPARACARGRKRSKRVFNRLKSTVMRPVILSSVGTGIFFIGIFMVTLPLIVTDIFGGGQLKFPFSISPFGAARLFQPSV